MYKVGKYGLIIIKPPLKPEFMSKYQKTIGPSNKAQSPFTYCLSIQPRKEAKTQWEKSSLKDGHETKFGNLVINHASQHDQQSLAVI